MILFASFVIVSFSLVQCGVNVNGHELQIVIHRSSVFYVIMKIKLNSDIYSRSAQVRNEVVSFVSGLYKIG